ncbi:MAG: YfiR family protein [Bacteroidales bacterium]|nr:YfiR family protein [Bacteroidales bacterium]
MKRFFILFFTLLTINLTGFAQSSLYEAEAGMIYNFTKFFDWPQTEKSDDFIIGIFGSKDLYKEMVTVTKDKKNVTQNIVVKYFYNFNNISKCHVIFVTSSKSIHLREIYKKTGVHCLIISDSMTAIEKGAAIQFFLENKRLKYDFSQENALKHGLKFHSKVSEMANKTYSY